MKPLNATRSLRTERLRVVQPLGWRRPKGYANGIVAEGRLLFIAGQIGWDPRSTAAKLPRGFAAQFDRALANVLDVLREAGGEPGNLARLTIYVASKKEYRAAMKQVGEAYRRRMGSHFPAMALVEVSSLLEDDAKVEIEATAVL
ncbi:MAG TPA: RidA family protein [Myxococcaceae bacterium]|nr:RidA family protein [Myxococcaceae bacterium]